MKMNKIILIILLILVHVIGAIVTLIIHYKDGTFEWASKHGDGIRFANPSDVIFQDLFLWEFYFLIFSISCIETFINKCFNDKYESEEK